jgi:hypothetical protein
MPDFFNWLLLCYLYLCYLYLCYLKKSISLFKKYVFLVAWVEIKILIFVFFVAVGRYFCVTIALTAESCWRRRRMVSWGPE